MSNIELEWTKDILSKYKELLFEKAILEKQIELGNHISITTRINEINIKIAMLDATLVILSQDENFVIQYHILQNYKWDEVVELYAVQYGNANAKSERTLKRMQASAVKKIANLIKNTNTANYLRECFTE